MERIFTETIGRFHKGAIRDFPRSTWQGIAESAGKKLDLFTKPVDVAAKAGIDAVALSLPNVKVSVERLKRGG